MIHDLEKVPRGTPQPGPAANLSHLIISECLKGGHTGIRLSGGGVHEGIAVLNVQYFVDGAWRDVMKIPAGPGAAVLARIRAMCDGAGASHPEQHGTFTVSSGGRQATVTAHFSRRADGVEHAELQLVPSMVTDR